MKNRQLRFRLFYILTVIVLSLGSTSMSTQRTWAQTQSATASTPETPETMAIGAADQATNNQIMFSIPVSDAGILYEGVEEQASLSDNTNEEVETLPWGPSALALGADGTFWVADDVGQRIRQYDPNGSLLTTIDTSERLGDVSDIAIGEHSLFALDMDNDEPILWELDLQGNTIVTYTLPITTENGLTGITLDDNTVWLEQLGGMYRTQFVNASGAQLSMNEEKIADWSTTNPNLVTLTIGDVNIDIQSARSLANVRLLQVTPSGDIFVAIEEMVLTPKTLVDQTVRHYKSDGTLLGMARVPLADQVVHVESNLTVAPNNEVYALVPRLDHIEVQRLEFSPDLPVILPDEDAQEDNQVFLPFIVSNRSEQTDMRALAADVTDVDLTTGCRDRKGMMDVARQYAQYSYTVHTNNTNSCPRRTPGRNMNIPGKKVGVAYKWGGWDTIGQFQSGLNSGKEVGDIIGDRDGGIDACSVGVDCSGFVSRLWGLQQKFSTRGLPGISTRLRSRMSLQPGDIMNSSGHVRVFAGWGSDHGKTGGFFYEATTSNFNRVVGRYLGWNAFYGYTPYRYKNVCSTTPPPPQPTPNLSICSVRPLLKQWDGYDNKGRANKKPQVRELQDLLNKKYGYQLDVDGYFGPMTDREVRDFQRSHNLAVDGIVGPQTWGTLCR